MEKTRILVVEDESIVALDIKKRLERLGYAVAATAYSGSEAIERAGETHPDVVLMDIRMPGSMDGIDAAAQIREQFDIPVVYLTAYGDEATLERAKVTKPFGYIIKPFDDRDLRVAVEIAADRHKIEQELAQRLREVIGLNNLLQNHLTEQFPVIEAVRDIAVKLHTFAQEASSLAEHAKSLLSRDIPAASEHNADDSEKHRSGPEE